MSQHILHPCVPESVPEPGQLGRHHPLIGLAEFAGALRT
jgi:hypothetical protein